jgi:hypothetical protein
MLTITLTEEQRSLVRSILIEKQSDVTDMIGNGQFDDEQGALELLATIEQLTEIFEK